MGTRAARDALALQRRWRLKTLTELMAKRCEKCPLCRRAREKPDSLFGKLMALHGRFCPFWRAWEKVYGSRSDGS